MITITVTLPDDVPPIVLDVMEVYILDDTRDRQPRHAGFESVEKTNYNRLKVTFST